MAAQKHLDSKLAAPFWEHRRYRRTLVDYFREVARLNKNSRRSAGFRVLKAPDVPSVLLELGYLSNAADVPNLVSTEWRDRVAGAVTQAIERFFATRDIAPSRAESDATTSLKASFTAAAGDGAVR